MNVPAKRVVLDVDNPLFRKAHPVLLDIFCRGVQAAESKRLMLGALLSITLSPVGWVAVLFRKAIHIGILLAVWLALRYVSAEFDSLNRIFLVLGILAILYKDIYYELVDMLLHLLVFVTGGGFLRWVCAGYLSGAGFRQIWLTSGPMERVVATMVAAIPARYRSQYDEIMDLYLDSNTPGKEEKLNQIVAEYSQ